MYEGLRRYAGGTAGGSPLMRRWVERLERYAAPGTREQILADVGRAVFCFAAEGRWSEGWARMDRARESARQLQDVDSFFLVESWGPVWSWSGPRQWKADVALALDAVAAPRGGVGTRSLAVFLEGCGWKCLGAAERDVAERTWRDLDELAASSREASLQLARLAHDGHLALLDGDLEGAVAAGARVVARAEELGSPVAGLQTAYSITFRALLYLGRAEEALAAAFAARERGGWADQPNYFRVGERALCSAWSGRTDDARIQLAEDLSRVEICEDTPVRILATLLETAIMLRDRDAAALLAPHLAETTGYVHPLRSIALLVGAAAALLGDGAGAQIYYQRSLEWASRLRCRPEIALTRLTLAELQLGQSATPGRSRAEQKEQRTAGLAHLDFAVAELRAMKMQPALERALHLQSGQRSNQAPDPRPSYPNGLTLREVEVLRLVAAGRSNQQIADALVISHNTVIRHVSNIFAKTGVANRVEAATYASHHGLV
jgi:DNA-binding CsgD family transcriptional regulator